MTPDLILVLILLLAAVAMFAVGKPRTDVVALVMLAALPFTGVLTIQEALAGFGDPTIVLIACLFVIGEALVRTGVAQWIADALARHAANSEARLIVLLMLVVGAVGSVMSSTAVVAIFIPVGLRIARNAGMSPGRLMMPLSMAALVSGMITLVGTTPNLVIQSELERRGYEGFDFFSITPFGAPILVLGVLYMLVARRWLPAERIVEASGQPRFAEWAQEYSLEGREHRLRVLADSPVCGKTVEALNVPATAGVNIIALERRGQFGRRQLIQPRLATRVEPDDVLLFDVFDPQLDIAEVCRTLGLERLPLYGGYFSDRTQEIGMAEMIVPPTSGLVGKSVLQAAIRTDYDLTVVGLKRGRDAPPHNIIEEALRPGDTLLVVGPWSAITRRRSDLRDLIAFNLPREFDDMVVAPGRAVQAICIIGFVIAMMVSEVMPNVHAALLGCLLLGLFGCMDMGNAYKTIPWPTLVLIVGLLPFSIALERTGGTDLAAEGLLAAVGGAGDHVTLAAIFAVTLVFGLFMSTTATAVLMGPVALEVASDLHASPYPFAMTVTLACSAAFMTPLSPVNTLVIGPGGYSLRDFLRIGAPFTLVAMLVTVVLAPILLPLRP